MYLDHHKSLKRTVLLLEEENVFCQCEGDFYKTCPLRIANDHPCKEAILGIHFIDRDQTDLADPVIRALDDKFRDLEHSIRHLEDKLKIR